MDTRTLQALGVVCNFETTKELQDLRKENMELKMKMKQMENNIKKLMMTFEATKIMFSTIDDREDEYENDDTPFRTLLEESIARQEDIHFPEKEIELAVELEAKYHTQLVSHLREDITSPICHITEEMETLIHQLHSFLFQKEEVFDYFLETYNPINFAIERMNEGSFSYVCPTLFPNAQMEYTIYNFETDEGIIRYYEENEDIIKHNYWNEYSNRFVMPDDFKAKRKLMIEMEYNGGIDIRCKFILDKFSRWDKIKGNPALQVLKPKLTSDDKPITIYDYMLYTSFIYDTLGITRNEIRFENVRAYMLEHNLMG